MMHDVRLVWSTEAEAVLPCAPQTHSKIMRLIMDRIAVALTTTIFGQCASHVRSAHKGSQPSINVIFQRLEVIPIFFLLFTNQRPEMSLAVHPSIFNELSHRVLATSVRRDASKAQSSIGSKLANTHSVPTVHTPGASGEFPIGYSISPVLGQVLGPADPITNHSNYICGIRGLFTIHVTHSKHHRHREPKLFVPTFESTKSDNCFDTQFGVEKQHAHHNHHQRSVSPLDQFHLVAEPSQETRVHHRAHDGPSGGERRAVLGPRAMNKSKVAQ